MCNALNVNSLSCLNMFYRTEKSLKDKSFPLYPTYCRLFDVRHQSN